MSERTGTTLPARRRVELTILLLALANLSVFTGKYLWERM